MNPADQTLLLDLAPVIVPRARRCHQGEYKLICIRESEVPNDLCDTPARAAEFWRKNIPESPIFDPFKECMVVLFLNTRRRITGFNIVSLGILDTLLVHAREVFRPAIVQGSSAVILMHNHPSGDPAPSDADVRATRDLKRAGDLLRIEVLDHIVMGKADANRLKDYASLRELGIFA